MKPVFKAHYHEIIPTISREGGSRERNRSPALAAKVVKEAPAKKAARSPRKKGGASKPKGDGEKASAQATPTPTQGVQYEEDDNQPRIRSMAFFKEKFASREE